MANIQQQINNFLTSDFNYVNFKGQFIYITFIVNVLQTTSSGINKIVKINNTNIIKNGDRFVLEYDSTLEPSNPNGIQNNLDGYSFNSSSQSIVLGNELFVDKNYSDTFFRNNITQSNISFLQLNNTQFNTNNNEICFIFRCEIDDNGQLITPCFNINSTFILSDFIFDIHQDADIINSWTIRNVEIHAKPSKTSCDVISNRLSDIALFF